MPFKASVFSCSGYESQSSTYYLQKNTTFLCFLELILTRSLLSHNVGKKFKLSCSWHSPALLLLIFCQASKEVSHSLREHWGGPFCHLHTLRSVEVPTAIVLRVSQIHDSCSFHSTIEDRHLWWARNIGPFFRLLPGKRRQERKGARKALIFLKAQLFFPYRHTQFSSPFRELAYTSKGGRGGQFWHLETKPSREVSCRQLLLSSLWHIWYSPEAKKHVAYYLPEFRRRKRKIHKEAINRYLNPYPPTWSDCSSLLSWMRIFCLKS